jgi:hypothetical protein
VANFLRRPSSNGVRSADGAASVDCAYCQRYPALAEFLTLSEWEPGQLRVTGTLLLFVEEGVWKACLHDRDDCKAAFVSSETFQGLLERVDEGLRGDDFDWRNKRQQSPRKR